MSRNNKQEYITYRLNKAYEALDDAKLLAQNKRWNPAINRLYYSCFYAVSALLLKHNIEIRTHEGIRSQFGLKFIKTGQID